MTTTIDQNPTDTAFVTTRTFDAPRDRVWAAYTDPAAVARWWGLRSSTTTVETMDVTPGGAWRYVQHEADGTAYVFFGEYREVVPEERLVNTFEFEPMPGHVVVETVEFIAEGERTRVVSTSQFQSAEDKQGMLDSGMEDGNAESWDQLAELLAETPR